MTNTLTGPELLDALPTMLRASIPHLDGVLEQFGQVAAVERRAAGERFTLGNHVRGHHMVRIRADLSPGPRVAGGIIWRNSR